MQKTLNKNLHILLTNTLSVVFAVICAIVLPQLFHAFGIYAGMGGKFGQMFLPMYLPVLILAFKTNAIAGVIAGVISPIISFSISGMPVKAMLPFIIIELASFGLFAGLIKDKKINIFAKIFLVQVLSKIVRILATVILGCFISEFSTTLMAVFNMIVLSIPGYIIQLLVVPYFVNKK